MKKFIVTWRENVVKCGEVEAINSDQASDIVLSGGADNISIVDGTYNIISTMEAECDLLNKKEGDKC